MSLSQPEFAAEGKTIGALVYFSSASENTARFVAGCRLQDEGINVYRIPLRAAAPALNVREPYVIMVPTYGGGVVKKAVPIQVKRFLNDPANREWIRGVIASGNTNFGEAYCAAGDIIAAKCKVPYLYRYELMGTPEDTAAVRNGLVRFLYSKPPRSASINPRFISSTALHKAVSGNLSLTCQRAKSFRFRTAKD